MISCESCQYWRPIKNREGFGNCYLSPPSVTLVPQEGIGGMGLAVVSYRPETIAGDVCGSFLFKKVESNLRLI